MANTTSGSSPATPATAVNGKKPRKAPVRRVRPPSEVALSQVLNLIARLGNDDRRKVMAAVQALIDAPSSPAA